MKIHQKLSLSFLGTSLLLGFLGFLSWRINSNIEHDSERAIKESLVEIKASTEMLQSLQEIQIYSQELLVKNDRESNSNSAEVDNKFINAKGSIEQNILNFEKNLFISLQSTRQIQELEELEEQEGDDIVIDQQYLKQIEEEFAIYHSLLDDYMFQTQQNPKEAFNVLETKLNPKANNILLPLLKEYKNYSLEEMESEAQEIKDSAARDNLLIFFFSVISIFISLGLGSFLSDYIRRTTVSKSYLDNILTSMVDSMIVINLEGNIEKLNQATLNLLGYKADELLGKNIDSILFDTALKNKSLDLSNFVGNYETVYFSKNGQQIPIAFSSSFILNEQGHARGIVCVAHDITEKYIAEKALKESEQRYALASRAANDGLWDWDLKNDKIYFSPRWKFLLGYEENSLGNVPNEWFKRVHPEYRQQLSQTIKAHLKNPISNFEISYPMLHADGNYRWMLCRGIGVKNDKGNVCRLTGSQTDITESKMAVEKLHHDALHDKLTGLPNRAFLIEKLEKLFKITKQKSNYLFAVLFVDLDRFKSINDSMGHLVGDRLLVEFTNRVKSCLRDQDTFARLAGDEFTILLEGIKELNEASTIAQRILTQLELPFKLKGKEVFVGASIGIAFSSNKYNEVEELLRDADIAMYQAKRQGKSRYIIFEPNMHLEVVSTLELENNLRRAIEGEEFKIFYQPIIKISNREIIGFEALVRWQHPEKGMIFPGQFISLAEETGLIVPIGWWVMEQASRQMRQWQEKYEVARGMSISVNVSPRQLQESNSCHTIEQILEKTTLKPECLKLEITESLIINNIDGTVSLLRELKRLGIKLSMDDFGMGYSSLNYLNRLPIDNIKIDRSFVSNLDLDPENIRMIQTIINLAKNIGADVIAEGIETNEQFIELKELNCQYGQGFLFSKPVSVEGAEILINTMEQLARV